MTAFSPPPRNDQPISTFTPLAGQASAALSLYQKDSSFVSWAIIAISIGVHVAFVLLVALILFIQQYFGINLLTFDRPQPIRDIEFQIVSAPDEKPRNPNTRNRAEHNSRSGGKKIPKLREAQAMKQAGTPKPKTKAQAQPSPKKSTNRTVAQKPTPRKAPRKSTQEPRPVAQQTESKNTAPTPPRPRVRVTTKSSSNRQHVAALPNPAAPIKVPDAPGPVSDTGPVVKGPSGGGSPGGSGSSASSGAPSTVPGQFSSGGGKPSNSGGPSGQGGRGSYSQYGSPGGGGGRAGIDAVAEPDFGPYLAELQRRIRRNWTPPEDREDKTVVMMFTISKDGRLLNITIKRSSGYANADGAARMAVERSAPFRPLPADYRHNSINVEFTFDYNVYTGRSGGISRR